MVAVAHGSLACYLKFKDHPDMQEWLTNSFAKSVCQVSLIEFNAEKAIDPETHVVLTESTLDGEEVAIVYCPRKEYPKRFKFFKLYR